MIEFFQGLRAHQYLLLLRRNDTNIVSSILIPGELMDEAGTADANHAFYAKDNGDEASLYFMGTYVARLSCYSPNDEYLEAILYESN